MGFAAPGFLRHKEARARRFGVKGLGLRDPKSSTVSRVFLGNQTTIIAHGKDAKTTVSAHNLPMLYLGFGSGLAPQAYQQTIRKTMVRI